MQDSVQQAGNRRQHTCTHALPAGSSMLSPPLRRHRSRRGAPTSGGSRWTSTPSSWWVHASGDARLRAAWPTTVHPSVRHSTERAPPATRHAPPHLQKALDRLGQELCRLTGCPTCVLLAVVWCCVPVGLQRPCPKFPLMARLLPTYLLSDDTPEGHAVVLMKVGAACTRCGGMPHRCVWTRILQRQA